MRAPRQRTASPSRASAPRAFSPFARTDRCPCL
ncbi:hypothetical protein BPC006_I3147 [Burkholderia pseudomallei BPC006]|nr:hypothetical protein BPC006_I3147 [Burkholderia pseudomallei BPC006]